MATYQSDSGITAKQIRAQRDRILASETFSLSRRQSAFLKHVINAALEGEADKLKESALGVNVFEKDRSFDPRVDSIVRVEATRLRAKLREYYGGDGIGDPVRIEIPKGHYVPSFCLTDATESGRSLPRQQYVWLGIAIAVLIAVLVFSTYQVSQRDPNSLAVMQQLPAPLSIAVLPLRDWSRLSDDYFSESMTDALISSLAEVRALRVTSLTSVMRYKDTDIPIAEIGRTLGVAYVVEGSLYREEDSVRITAQLIATNADEYIWSSTFERPMVDLFSMQNEVATAVAAQISDELLPSSQQRVEGKKPAAYDAYLKGRYFYNQFTADGYRRGMSYFQDAINIEPDYAEAYAGLASCHCLLAGHGLELVSPVIAIPKAHSLAMKALSINSELAEPNAFLGIISFKFGWDPEDAESKLNRAIELNPSLFHAYLWHSQILEALGRNDEAIDRARFAKRLNPLSLAASLNYGWQMFQAGQYIQASAEIDDLIEFSPDFWGGHWAKGHIFSQNRSFEIAIEEFQQAVDLGGGHSLPMSALGYAFAVAGRTDEARKIIAELEALSQEMYVSPFHLATVYAGLNEPDRMFEWLERAYEVRARSLAWLQVTREMRPFHEDVRYQDLLKRIGIAPDVDSDSQARNIF